MLKWRGMALKSAILSLSVIFLWN